MSEAQANALLVEPDRETLRLLSKKLESLGVNPLCSRRPDAALRLLAETQPHLVLAVVRHAGRRSVPGASDGLAVLDRLFADFPNCIVIALSRHPELYGSRRALALAHPGVVLHTASDMKAFDWMHGAFRKTVGDLRLDHGVVVHSPTLSTHRHPIGLQLLLHYPGALTLRDVANNRAIRRLAWWLSTVGSTMSVIAEGNWRYRLAPSSLSPGGTTAPESPTSGGPSVSNSPDLGTWA